MRKGASKKTEDVMVVAQDQLHADFDTWTVENDTQVYNNNFVFD